MSSEPNYSGWTLRGIWGEAINLTSSAERDISAALKLRQIEKASRIFEKYQERIGCLLELLKERIAADVR